MSMSFFKLHFDIDEMFGSVSDEHLGQGIRALIAYVNTGEIPTGLDTPAQIVFDTLLAQKKRDDEAYKRICERNKKNGKSGGRPRKPKETQENPRKPKETPKTEEKEKEKEEEIKEKENNIIIGDFAEQNAPTNLPSKKQIDKHFEEMWKLYPNKKGKGQVSNTRRKKLFDITIDEMTRAIERYKSELKKDDWRVPQYGSTFFNSGYVDYLDANYQEGNGIEQKQSTDAKGAELSEAELRNQLKGFEIV